VVSDVLYGVDRGGIAMDDALRDEIMTLNERDAAVHEAAGPPALASDPRIAAAHRETAARLMEIVQRRGWPDEQIVGKEAAHIAWTMVYHLIDQPDFERYMLARLEEAAEAERIERWRPAFVEDRIRASEGRLQKYGTRFGWNESGEVGPDPSVEDPDNVDSLRGAVGLPPLEHELAERRRAARGRTAPLPAEIAKQRKRFEALCRFAGWRS
jgi:hypothetical protein